MEIGVPRTESDMPKMNAKIRLRVSDAEKISRSLGERILLQGIVKCSEARSGGDGSEGVSGGGSVSCDELGCLRLGTRVGIA